MPGSTALWPQVRSRYPWIHIIAQIFGIVNFRSTLTLSDMKCLVLSTVRRLNNSVYVVRHPYKEDRPRTTKAFKFRLIRKFNPIQEITVLFVYEWVLKVFSPVNHYHRCWSGFLPRIYYLSTEKGFFHLSSQLKLKEDYTRIEIDATEIGICFWGHPLPFLSPNKFIHVSISISPDRHVAFDVFSLVHLLVGSSVLNDSWYIGSELYYYLVLEIHSSSPVSIVMLVMLAEWEISLSVSASPGFPPTSRHHQHGR